MCFLYLATHLTKGVGKLSVNEGFCVLRALKCVMWCRNSGMKAKHDFSKVVVVKGLCCVRRDRDVGSENGCEKKLQSSV